MTDQHTSSLGDMVTIVTNDQSTWAQSLYQHPTDLGVWWVDAGQPTIFRYSPDNGALSAWRVNQTVGFALPCDGEDHDLILGLNNGIGLGVFGDQFVDVEVRWPYSPEGVDLCSGPGSVDCFGGLWMATQHLVQQLPVGRLYNVRGQVNLSRVMGPFQVVSGILLDPSGRTIYLSVAEENSIFRASLNPSGTVLEHDVFHKFDKQSGVYPSGMALDIKGHLWVCLTGLGAVVEINDRGQIVQQIQLPTKQITDCCFAGADRRTLYVSSAALGCRANDDASGNLFAVSTGTRGLEGHLFRTE